MLFPSLISSTKTLWPQWVGSFGAFLTIFVIGLMMGWSSPYLAKLQAPDSPLPITESEASWVASLVNLGRLPGAIMGAVGVEYFGSRKTVLFTNIAPALAWICLIFANSVAWLYTARFLAGIGFGSALGCFPMYLGEISDSSIRGAIVGLAIGALPLGTLVGNIMGAYMSVMLFAIIALIPNTITIILFFFLPDSPHYFMRQGRIPESEISIHWYNRGADVENEIAKLEQFVNDTGSLSWAQRIKELLLRKNRRGIVVIIILYIIVQFSGLVTIVFYLEIILTNAGVTIMTPATLVIVVAAIGILAGWTSMILVDKCGRKSLLIASCTGVASSMVMLGVHFILISIDYDPTELQWLPITSIVTFQIFVNLGITPIPSTILSELFSSNTKSIAALLASFTGAVFGFASTATYQPLINLITEAYTYFLYAVIMILSALYTFFFVPETKGKSLQEIQDKLSRRKQTAIRNSEIANAESISS